MMCEVLFPSVFHVIHGGDTVYSNFSSCPLVHQWDAENIYLILEWCSGGDLSQFIRSRRILPERVVKRFLQQIGKLVVKSFI